MHNPGPIIMPHPPTRPPTHPGGPQTNTHDPFQYFFFYHKENRGPAGSNLKLPNYPPLPEEKLREISDLVELLGLDDGIGFGDLLSSHLFEIEGAAVVLRVPVGPAERHSAPALEPREPHAPPARQAPVRHRHRRRSNRNRLLRLRFGLFNDENRRRRRR